jgi:hypothetical protein
MEVFWERRKRLLQARKELSYYSILPTATQYAKCDFLWFIAVEMEKQFPQYWKNDPEKVKLIWSRILDGTTEAFGTELEKIILRLPIWNQVKASWELQGA